MQKKKKIGIREDSNLATIDKMFIRTYGFSEKAYLGLMPDLLNYREKESNDSR